MLKRKPSTTAKELSREAAFKLFATTDAGLEVVLADELRRLGASGITLADRGVSFQGDLSLVYRANIHLRTAYRVLLTIAVFDAFDRASLYDGVRCVAWADHLSPDQTLAVDAVSHRSELSHTQFISRVVKDGIVDHFRDRVGRRPSVDAKAADFKLNARIHKDICTLSIDTSGDRLNRRGYRPEEGVKAPLKETLAAGILIKSGFDGSVPLLDPMCGSGTLLIEGALIAKRVAPGLLGRAFGFTRHLSFDRKLYKDMLREARAAVLTDVEVPVIGSDIDDQAVRALKAAASGAGVDDIVRVKRSDFRDMPLRDAGMIVTNPPYGERLGELSELETLYRDLGDTFKQRCAGMTAHVLTGSRYLAKHIGLRSTRRDILFNGPIECRLLHFELY